MSSQCLIGLDHVCQVEFATNPKLVCIGAPKSSAAVQFGEEMEQFLAQHWIPIAWQQHKNRQFTPLSSPFGLCLNEGNEGVLPTAATNAGGVAPR